MSSSCEDDALLDVHSCRRIRCQRCLKSGFHYARVNLLLLLTIASVVLGLVIGFSVRNASQLAQELTSLPGELFLRSLKMMILPLIVLSLMSGLGSLDIRAVGSLGIRTLIFYSATTIVALCTGLLLVLIIRPGEINAPAKHCTNSSSVSINDISDTVLDLIRSEKEMLTLYHTVENILVRVLTLKWFPVSCIFVSTVLEKNSIIVLSYGYLYFK